MNKTEKPNTQTLLTVAATLITLTALVLLPGIFGEITAQNDNREEIAGECDEERIYAAVLSTRKHQLSGENPVVGVFSTTDGGDSWSHTGWKQGRTFAVMKPPGSCGDTLFTASGNGVMRTRDGGDFWKITTGWRITEVQDIAITPGRINRIFAATPYGVFRSDDFGKTWQEYSLGLPSDFVASIRVDRTDPDRVFAGTEEGLSVSGDAGAHWQPLPLRDPIRSVRQSPVEPNLWVAGLQDRGVAVSRDDGNTWSYVGGAVGQKTIYECEFHPENAEELVAGGWSTGVFRSRDFGESWTQLMPGQDTLSVHCLAFSRENPERIFIGSMGKGIFRTENDGDSWEAIAPQHFEAAQVWDLYVEGEQ